MPAVPVAFPQQIGQEYSGMIDRLGDGVEGWRPGDEVLGSTMLNGQAAVVVVDAGTVVRKPAHLDFPTAAGLVAAAQTASGALRDEAIAQSAALGVPPDRIGTIVAGNPPNARTVRAPRDPARLAEVTELAARGVLALPIRAFPLAEVAEAHRVVETGHGRGKVVLIVEPG